MSLVTLNSKDQPAHDFSNHFPQPMKLPPNAQVCVQSFRHHRNNGEYLVNEDNNVLRFMIGGPGSNDSLRAARIAVGQYTGAEMAAAVTTALNEATHQQTFQWLVTHVAATATDYDKFHIAATQAAAPGSEGGKWVDFGGGRHTINTADAASTKITPALIGVSDEPCQLTHGVLLNGGKVGCSNIGPSHAGFQTADCLEMPDVCVGFCRKSMADPGNADPNLRFNPLEQDFLARVHDGGTQGDLVLDVSYMYNEHRQMIPAR